MKTAIPFGRRLELVCETDVEVYRFGADGSVTATLGQKNGPVCGPILRHEVLSRDSIALSGSDGVVAVWTRIARDGDILRVECNGVPKVFRIE